MDLNNFKSCETKLRPRQRDIVNRYAGSEVKLKTLQKKLAKLQEAIQAEGKHAVLIIFQAMDAAGKDSTIRNVFRLCDIAGIDSVAFKQPSKEETAHDFIWRCHKKTPKKGNITIFNRSYYEEVLVVKVHPEWLASQGVTTPVKKSFWNDRYTSINNFEKHLCDSGTTVIKFMLDVSQQEQHKRLIRRYSTPDKQWKFSTGDIKESKLWEKYQAAFDLMLANTSSKTSPWHVIPADDKDLMRLLVTEILIKELMSLKPKFPKMQSFDDSDLKLIDELVSGTISATI
ncbi:MAG: polyphosphate kinase 2 family protein [Proteobacteria bacterium]|nr:polyphosphate kinase 2 family protein [Pseudomonadota bacterium]